MDLDDALEQAKSAMLRAEAEGFDNTADALGRLATEIARIRRAGAEQPLGTQEVPLSNVQRSLL